MTKNNLGWLILIGVAGWVYYQKSQQDSGGNSNDSAVSFMDDPLASVSDVIVSTTAGWKSVGDAAQWVPVLNAAEIQFGIPADLLARIAYQESRFRTDIITGAKDSPAGAAGLMQLMPQYFNSVKVARPFTPDDTVAQIQEAAQLLASNYRTLQTWPLAVAAYNAGVGTIQSGNASAANKAATASYVAAIIADVPGANA